MQIFDFFKEYEARTDEELLRLSLESDQLTDDANQAWVVGGGGEGRRGRGGDPRLNALRHGLR